MRVKPRSVSWLDRTGKSQTIEERIRWLPAEGTNPAEIAVVSFTNASVIDLRERLHAYCAKNHQPGIERVSITTLHSLALRMLSQARLLEAYPTRPLVLDEWELENIYDAEFGEAEGIGSKPRREQIRRFYEALWSTGVPDAITYVAAEPPVTDDERRHFDQFHQPTRIYSAVLPGELVRKCVDAAVAGLIDPANLLGIRYLVVDEYQDLNPTDLEFVDRLAARGVSIFVAGDDDQSIYSFRHASPLGIQTFTQRYPQAAGHVLDHCFRCASTVLRAAAHVILQNASSSRIPKALASLYETSEPPNPGVVYRWRFPSGNQEAAAIARSCALLIAGGLQPSQILVLLANRRALWPSLQEALVQVGAPFDPPREEGFSDSKAGSVTYDPRRLQGVALYHEANRAFATGDRVQMTAPDQQRAVANRELGTIERIETHGRMEIRWDSGRTSSFDAGDRRHLDYGYAVTSHSSQGQTTGRVLVHAETARASEKLVNQRLAYVAVSRGQYDARIYTDDKVKLARVLDRDVFHRSALERTPGQGSLESEGREVSRSESTGHTMAVGST